MKANTQRTRLFTNEFVIGDAVGIVRHRHGWHDGELHGKITSMNSHEATVKSEDGCQYEIEHPRDIRKL